LATSKMEVFNKFLALVNDSSICSLLTDEDMTRLLSLFLSESSSIRFKNCKKNLSDATNAVFYRENFTGDGATTSFVIAQYPATPNEDSIELFATVSGTDVSYTFTEATKTFVLASTPTLGVPIILGYDDVGQFNETLNDEEQWILAHGMIISWQSDKLNHNKLLSNRLTSKDFKSFSPAMLLDKMILLRKQSLTEIRRLIVSYSFNDFTGFV